MLNYVSTNKLREVHNPPELSLIVGALNQQSYTIPLQEFNIPPSTYNNIVLGNKLKATVTIQAAEINLTTSYALVGASVSTNGDGSLQVTRTAGGSTWGGSSIYGTTGATGYIRVEFRSFNTTGHFIVGFSKTPAADANYTFEYGLYCQAGNLLAYASGGQVGTGGSYSTSDQLKIEYTGTQVKYYKNNVAFATITVAIPQPLYLDSSLYTSGTFLTDLKVFGPGSGVFPSTHVVKLYGNTRFLASTNLVDNLAELYFDQLLRGEISGLLYTGSGALVRGLAASEIAVTSNMIATSPNTDVPTATITSVNGVPFEANFIAIGRITTGNPEGLNKSKDGPVISTFLVDQYMDPEWLNDLQKDSIQTELDPTRLDLTTLVTHSNYLEAGSKDVTTVDEVLDQNNNVIAKIPSLVSDIPGTAARHIKMKSGLVTSVGITKSFIKDVKDK